MTLPYGCGSFAGPLGVWSEGDTIVQISFLAKGEAYREPATRAERAVIDQLRRYFADPTHRIKGLRLSAADTDLQAAFRRLLCGTAAGELLTYSTAARLLGTSARAVGGLCASNPHAVAVPCHRIIGKQGLGGYSGPHAKPRDNLLTKRRLIDHEHAAL